MADSRPARNSSAIAGRQCRSADWAACEATEVCCKGPACTRRLLQQHHACNHAGRSHSGAADREKAFNVAVSAWLPCGLIFACAALTLGRDEDAMQVLASLAVLAACL